MFLTGFMADSGIETPPNETKILMLLPMLAVVNKLEKLARSDMFA